jgi:DNA topoisomerase IB
MLLDDHLPARLRWVDDAEPGITRRRAGNGFSYRDPRGRSRLLLADGRRLLRVLHTASRRGALRRAAA